MSEEQWTYEDVFPEQEPEVEEKQAPVSEVEARLARLEERERKIAQKEKLEEEARRVDEAIKKFYAVASDDEKELAAIFLEGSESLSQVERAIKLIKTKAGVKKGSEPSEQADGEAEQAAEQPEEEQSEAFKPPISGEPVRAVTLADRKYSELVDKVSSQGDPLALLKLIALDDPESLAAKVLNRE